MLHLGPIAEPPMAVYMWKDELNLRGKLLKIATRMAVQK